MLNKIKEYFVLDCVIFTVMTVVLSVVYKAFGVFEAIGADDNFFEYFTDTIFSYFTVTTTITFLFFVFHKITDQGGIVGHLASMLIVVATVYGLGSGVFHWFPLFSMWSLYTFLVIVFVYVIVFVSVFRKDVEISNQINKKLKDMQEERNEQNN